MDRGEGILVLGYGNTQRGDDGVGPRIAGVVAGWGLPNVNVIERHQLTPELADPISRASHVIFVDAVVNQPTTDVQVSPLLPAKTTLAWHHATSPGALLALAGSVFGRAPNAWMVSIPVSELGLGEGLSEQAQRGVDEALVRVRELVQRARPDGGPETRAQ
jgi:hydrogenase maturation protease